MLSNKRQKRTHIYGFNSQGDSELNCLNRLSNMVITEEIYTGVKVYIKHDLRAPLCILLPLPSALLSIIIDYDGRIETVFSPVISERMIMKDPLCCPLYNIPMSLSQYQDRLHAFHGRGGRTNSSFPCTVLRGANNNQDLYNLCLTAESGHMILRKSFNLFQATMTFQTASIKVGNSYAFDGFYFVCPTSAVNSWSQTSRSAASRRGSNFWKPRPWHKYQSRNFLTRHHDVLHITPFDVLVVHQFSDDIPVQLIYNVKNSTTFRPYTDNIGLVKFPENVELRSTVQWVGIVHLGFMSSMTCPYGTFSNMDYIKLVVVNTVMMHILA
jgi:hypothetical protein